MRMYEAQIWLQIVAVPIQEALMQASTLKRRTYTFEDGR